MEAGEMGALRDQGGEPAALIAHRDALRDHSKNEGPLAPGAPQLAGLAAEIQGARTGPGRTQVPPFSPVARRSFRRRSVERRIAHRQIELLARSDHVFETLHRRGLATALDQAGHKTVGSRQLLRPAQGHRVDLRAHKAPPVLARADQRVDAVRAHPDIQNHDGPAPGDGGFLSAPEQVGDVMKIVTAARDGRAQVAWRHVPGLQPVGVFEQRLVEGLHGFGIRIVDGLIPVRIGPDEGSQARARFDQRPEIVTGAEAVSRVHLFFPRWVDHGSGFSLRPRSSRSVKRTR